VPQPAINNVLILFVFFKYFDGSLLGKIPFFIILI